MTKPFLDLVDGHIFDGEQTELQSPSQGQHGRQSGAARGRAGGSEVNL